MLVFIGEDCYCDLSLCSEVQTSVILWENLQLHSRDGASRSHVRTSKFANKCQYRPCKFPCFYSRLHLQWPFKATVPSVSCSFFQVFQLAPRQSPGFCFSTSFPFLNLIGWSEFTRVRQTLPTERFALYPSEMPGSSAETERVRR